MRYSFNTHKGLPTVCLWGRLGLLHVGSHGLNIRVNRPPWLHTGNRKNSIVAKVRGLQSQGANGAAVVNLLQALDNAGSCVLRLSPKNIR